MTLIKVQFQSVVISGKKKKKKDQMTSRFYSYFFSWWILNHLIKLIPFTYLNLPSDFINVLLQFY